MIQDPTGAMVELIWPEGHRLNPDSMDMAFELWTSLPTPTPTPTGTPTPSPTPTPTPTPPSGSKWAQPPNMKDGFDVLSWGDDDLIDVRVADDFLCLDGNPIVHIRWWGSYPGYEEVVQDMMPPPDIGLLGFWLRWYEYDPGETYSIPGNLIAEEFCDNYTEYWYGSVPRWDNSDLFEHEYLYDCDLLTSWTQEEDKTYFLSIQAVLNTSDPLFTWGWKNSEIHWNDDAVQTAPGAAFAWAELLWPDGHRLQGKSMDMAFELWTRSDVPTPTPTPTPYVSPTPTPTPPPGVKWAQPPNFEDGFDMPSWMDTSGVSSLVVADDFLCMDGLPINRIRWWGSYPGWMKDVDTNVDAPTTRPVSFRLSWHQYSSGPAFSIPGALIDEQICNDFTEQWFAAIPRWDDPGTYEHEYVYECDLPEEWRQEKDKTYFLNIQAVFDTPHPEYVWGWLNSSVHWNDDAVLWVGGGWNELVWPDGHPFEGKSMDMAFELYTRKPTTQELVNHLVNRAGGLQYDYNNDGIFDIADLLWLILNENE